MIQVKHYTSAAEMINAARAVRGRLFSRAKIRDTSNDRVKRVDADKLIEAAMRKKEAIKHLSLLKKIETNQSVYVGEPETLVYSLCEKYGISHDDLIQKGGSLQLMATRESILLDFERIFIRSGRHINYADLGDLFMRHHSSIMYIFRKHKVRKPNLERYTRPDKFIHNVGYANKPFRVQIPSMIRKDDQFSVGCYETAALAMIARDAALAARDEGISNGQAIKQRAQNAVNAAKAGAA